MSEHISLSIAKEFIRSPITTFDGGASLWKAASSVERIRNGPQDAIAEYSDKENPIIDIKKLPKNAVFRITYLDTDPAPDQPINESISYLWFVKGSKYLYRLSLNPKKDTTDTQLLGWKIPKEASLNMNQLIVDTGESFHFSFAGEVLFGIQRIARYQIQRVERIGAKEMPETKVAGGLIFARQPRIASK